MKLPHPPPLKYTLVISRKLRGFRDGVWLNSNLCLLTGALSAAWRISNLRGCLVEAPEPVSPSEHDARGEQTARPDAGHWGTPLPLRTSGRRSPEAACANHSTAPGARSPASRERSRAAQQSQRSRSGIG